jgi:hypothetical protein
MSQSRHSTHPTQEYSTHFVQHRGDRSGGGMPQPVPHARGHGYGQGHSQATDSYGAPPPWSQAGATGPSPHPYGQSAPVDWPAPPPRPPHPSKAGIRKVRKSRQSPQVLLAGAGGGAVALALLAVVPQFQTQAPASHDLCQQVVEAQSVLGRDELSELLAIPERASREAVQAVIAQPYCTLSQTEVREGVMAEREAYPLAFDPQTWFVVLYEDGEYAGYDFSFTREAR